MSGSLPDAASAGEPGGTVPCCPPEEDGGGAGRRKLWELDPGSFCSLIGTCLSLEDLRKIIRKADLSIAPDAQDYDIHGYFVTRVGSRSPLSKLVHKTLDRKYAVSLGRFRRASTAEELWALWRQAMGSGEVAGAYWALLTHKGAPRAICIRAHNEVHMLSHLMGKSSRDEIRRVQQLEAACAALSERLEKVRARADATLRERDARIRSLEAKLAATPAPRVSPYGVKAEGRRDERRLQKLRARFASLERRLKAERARARAAESRLLELSRVGQPAAASRTASTAPGLPPRGDRMADAATKEGLQGCSLLYVGGHPNVMPKLREHVERMQGRFLYHDGGIEMQNTKLPGLVSQADAVFCPVACISHDACLRLKHLCKRHGKWFVPLRSAGLSGFASAVSEMARNVLGGNESAGPLVLPASAAARVEVGHGGTWAHRLAE